MRLTTYLRLGKTMRRRILCGLAVATTAVLIFYVFRYLMQSETVSPEVIPALENPVGMEVDMVNVTRRDVCDEVIHIGEIVPEIVELYFDDAGEIDKMHVSVGDKVKKGKRLATLAGTSDAEVLKEKDKELEAVKKRHKSTNNISEAEISAMEDTRKELEKSYRAEKGKAYKKQLNNQLKTQEYDIRIAKQKLQQAKELQRLEIKKLEKERKEIKDNAGFKILTAPLDADVIGVSGGAGSMVYAGTVVIRLAKMKSPRVRTKFIVAKELEKSSSYVAAVNGKEYDVTAEEVEVENWQLDYNEVPSHTYFDFEQKNIKCKVGDFAMIHLRNNMSENTLSVPINAVWNDDKSYYVYVDENGAKVRRTVTVGVKSPAYAEILTGVEEGEFVYVES